MLPARKINDLGDDGERAHTPNEYEKTTYYLGIAGGSHHPDLLYRSNFLTHRFPAPVGRFGQIPTKSLRGVFNTSLNRVWDTVGPKIRDILKTHNITWVSIDPARFFTHPLSGDNGKGSLGPPIIWIAVKPGSTTSDTAHRVSQEILALLLKDGVSDVVVEWREAVLRRLTGPPLLQHVDNGDVTHHLRRFLTPLLGIPLATEGTEKDEVQGTLTLWFHEDKDKHGNPSDKVYGVTNCHVLRKNTAVEYEHKGDAPKDHVRVCGMHRFERGVHEIESAIIDREDVVEDRERDLAKLENANQDATIAFRKEVEKDWSNMKVNRNIGYVHYTAPIMVDVEGGTLYTSDWGAFVANEEKVKENFEGNVIDIGSKYSRRELTEMFYPRGGGPTMFKFPEGRKLRIVGCATEAEIKNPADRDHDDEPCLIVGKDGNTTDFTIGRYAGLESFSQNDEGTESMELAIYNMDHDANLFSDIGDSGSLVWFMKDGKAYMLGQLHSGHHKGGSSGNHVTYCTPAWYLLEQIRKKFPYADFYRTSWS